MKINLALIVIVVLCFASCQKDKHEVAKPNPLIGKWNLKLRVSEYIDPSDPSVVWIDTPFIETDAKKAYVNYISDSVYVESDNGLLTSELPYHYKVVDNVEYDTYRSIASPFRIYQISVMSSTLKKVQLTTGTLGATVTEYFEK